MVGLTRDGSLGVVIQQPERSSGDQRWNQRIEQDVDSGNYHSLYNVTRSSSMNTEKTYEDKKREKNVTRNEWEKGILLMKKKLESMCDVCE